MKEPLTSWRALVRARRSVRDYDGRDVPDALVTEILDDCRHAPSSMDGQPWCFVVIRDARTKARLAALKNEHCAPAKRAYPADFLEQAPVVVAVAVETARAHGRAREAGVLATAWLLLAARARGLGSVYLSAYGERERALERALARLLGLPAGVEPVTLVPLGFPAADPAPKELRPLADMLHHERHDRRVPRRD